MSIMGRPGHLIHEETLSSKLSFKVEGGPKSMGCDSPPTHGNQPSPTCANVTLPGDPVPVKGPAASKACVEWREGIPT